MFVAVDPDNEQTRIVGRPKKNLGRTDVPSLTFTIEGARVADTAEGPVWAGRIAWQGEADRSVDDVLRSASESADSKSATSEAMAWLSDYLTVHQVVFSQQIKVAAKDDGHGQDALKRVRQRIGAGPTSPGFPRRTHRT